MGLYDRPIVDTAAENSTASVIALRNHFQDRHGFIAREDVPDKGCDLMVEIIIDKDAVNWRFPVQLKSIVDPTFIEKGKYISHQFELSRLGYLLNHKPIVGIIVFYSVDDEKLYFEYVDKIYHRLKDQHHGDEWMQQEKANIHMPVENILDYKSRESIHRYVVNAFTNNEAMYKEQASDYNLPVTEVTPKKDAPQGLKEKAEQVLRDHGLQFLNEMDIKFLDQLLSVLPNQTIVNDIDIALIAAQTYHEMGLYVDADYYLSKVLYKKNLLPQSRLSAEWTKAKNDYLLRRISRTEYIETLVQIRQTVPDSDKHNQIMLDLNLVHHQIRGESISTQLPKEIEHSFDNFARDINELQSSEDQKNFLQLMNACNFSLFIKRINDVMLSDVNSRESIGQKVPLHERLASVRLIVEMQSRFKKMVLSIYNKARENNKALLQAEALSILCESALSFDFSLILSKRGNNLFTKEEHSEKMNLDIKMAYTAAILYSEVAYHEKAYQSLCVAVEFIHISQFYELKVDANINELTLKMAEFQESLNLPDYEFQSLKLIKLVRS